MKAILKTKPFGGNFIVRLMVGMVFLSEGVQKFLFAETLGSGRFEKIGISHATFWGPFVGFFEIICGTFLLLGLYTRISAIPTFIIIIVALATTKSELFADKGFWEMVHGSRTDWAMLLGSVYLIMYGGGLWSIDYILFKKGNGYRYRFY